MLKLEVMHYKGAVPPRAIAAQFGAQGGTVGRADTNTLVLPDAERFISRTHARIKFQGGHYVIEDHGSSTPVMLNGRALGRGSEAALAHGDELTIGEYQLHAIVQLVMGGAAPAAGAGNSKASDPMTQFGAAPSADPFADLIPKPAPLAQAPGKPETAFASDPFAATDKPMQMGIPADFDPFSSPAQPAASAAVPPLGAATGPGFGVSAQSQSLDALFGLNPASASDPLGGTGPLAAPGLVDPLNSTPSLDPLAVFRTTPAPSAAPVQRNDAPEIDGTFRPPKPVAEAGVAKPAERAPPVVAPREILASAAAPPSSPPPVAPSSAQPALPSAAPSVPQPPAPMVQAQPATAAVDEEDALAATQRVAVVRPGGDALAQAFLEGAGIANFNLPAGLSAQTMNMLGQVLRQSVQTILELLLARATLKREMRAEVTMIVAQENNPLKFSPNVEAALMHLLAPQRGYMQPLDAVKDACDDLLSNQFAFMAGMRAALAGILQRFNPEQLEQRLKHKSMLDALLPANRKAKMWDLFSDMYGDVSREAEDNFHEIFGREFVRAYEAQVAKLSGNDSGGRR